VVGCIVQWFICLQTITNQSNIWAQHGAVSLIKTGALILIPVWSTDFSAAAFNVSVY